MKNIWLKSQCHNEVSMEHSRAYSSVYCTQLLSYNRGRVEELQHRSYVWQSPKYLPSGPLQENFLPIPDLNDRFTKGQMATSNQTEFSTELIQHLVTFFFFFNRSDMAIFRLNWSLFSQIKDFWKKHKSYFENYGEEDTGSGRGPLYLKSWMWQRMLATYLVTYISLLLW